MEGRGVTEERKAGYLKVLREAGVEPVVLTGKASRQFGRECASKLKNEHPEVDAVVCFNDLVALGMLSGCHELGIGAGTEFRIVGFDDIEEIAHTYPSLSSVHCDIAGIGTQAAQKVVEWLEKGIVPPPETRTPVSLSIRQSTGGI